MGDPPPPTPSMAERVRVVAQGLQLTDDDRVSCDEIDALLRRLGIGLSPDLLGHLCAALDSEGSIVMGVECLAALGEMFPALLDSMYYRSLDLEADALQRDEIDRERAALADLASQREHLQIQIDRSILSVKSAEIALEQADNGVRSAMEKEARLHHEYRQKQEDLAGRDALVREVKEGLGRQRGELRQITHALTSARETVREAGNDVRVADRDVDKAALAVRGLERQLEQARQMLQGKEEQAERVREKHQAALDRQEELEMALHEVKMPMEDTQLNLASLENNAQTGVANCNRAEGAAALASRETERHRQSKDDAERELRNAHTKVDTLREGLEALDADMGEQERRVSGMEARNRDWRLERKQLAEEDFVLLEQELSLRSERQQIEDEEKHFRASVKGITSSTRRNHALSGGEAATSSGAGAGGALALSARISPARGRPGPQPSPGRAGRVPTAHYRHRSPTRHEPTLATNAQNWGVEPPPQPQPLPLLPADSAPPKPHPHPAPQPTPAPNLEERIQYEHRRLVLHRSEHIAKIASASPTGAGELADAIGTPLPAELAGVPVPSLPDPLSAAYASHRSVSDTRPYESTPAPVVFTSERTRVDLLGGLDPMAPQAPNISPTRDRGDIAPAAATAVPAAYTGSYAQDAQAAADAAAAAESRAFALLSQTSAHAHAHTAASVSAGVGVNGGGVEVVAGPVLVDVLGSSSVPMPDVHVNGVGGAERATTRQLTSPPSPTPRSASRSRPRRAPQAPPGPPVVSVGPSKYQVAMSERRRVREEQRREKEVADTERAKRESQRRTMAPARLQDAPCYLRGA